MSDPIVIAVSPPSVKVKPGEEASALVVISNRAEVVAQFWLRAEGLPESWVYIAQGQLSAFPFQQVQTQVTIRPPAKARGATYSLVLRAISQEPPYAQGTAVLLCEVPQSAPIPPPAAQPASPVAAPPARSAAQIQVIAELVENPALSVGGAQWRVLMRNAGVVLDTFSFRVRGLRPKWFQAEPPQVTLKPLEEGSALFTVAPEPGAAAGAYPFVLSVFSHLNLNERTDLQLQITIPPFAGYQLLLSPREAESQGMREFAISVQSEAQSNVELRLALSAVDPDNACDYQLEPDHLTLPARGSSSCSLRVRPRQVLAANERKLHVFQVTAVPLDGRAALQRVEGRLTQVGAKPLYLSLRPEVQSGEIQAEYIVSVVNPSDVETLATLSASDPEAACTLELQPAQLLALPRAASEARLKIRAREYREGTESKTYPFRVLATRQGELLPVATVEGQFVQQPVKPATLALLPPQQRSPARAEFQLHVSNPRPFAAALSFSAQDEAAALDFTFVPASLQLAARAEATVRLLVSPKDPLPSRDQGRVHKFTVYALIGGSAEMLSAQGLLAQIPERSGASAPASARQGAAPTRQALSEPATTAAPPPAVTPPAATAPSPPAAASSAATRKKAGGCCLGAMIGLIKWALILALLLFVAVLVLQFLGNLR